MDTLFSKVAGLDVHLKTVQFAVRCQPPSGNLLKEVRCFGTMTRDLRALADYLAAWGVTHVALEATGVLWKPVWNLLEGRFTLLLVNPRHLKKVPGRKTDVSDAEWIAQLLQHGLLRGSFVPPRAVRDLRDLTRHRAQLTAEHTRVANRIHKLLEDTHVTLGAVASDVLGQSGRAMLRALLRGEQDEARKTRPLVWHFPNNWGPKGPGIGPSSAIRVGDWKLIYYHEDRRCELFNLAQDLGEQTNLADKQPDIRDRLAAELRRYLAAVEAQMPVVKSTGEAVPYPDARERRGGGN